ARVMASRPRRPRRLVVAAVLGAILAGEITGIALGRSLAPVVVSVTSPDAASHVAATAPKAFWSSPAEPGDGRSDVLQTGVDLAARQAADARPIAIGHSLEAPARTKSSTTGAHHATTAAKAPSKPASYHGVNHVWIPGLGINKGVQSFPCSR